MKYAICFLLVVSLNWNAVSQLPSEKKMSRFSLTAAAGINVHTYTKDYPGWYIKLGTTYRIWKGLSAGIRLWHSEVDEFPKRLKAIPFSPEDEAEFIRPFLGISEKEWKGPAYKGFYHSFEGNILSFSLGYEVKIRKRFIVTPHGSINFLRSRSLVAGLYQAWFINDRLTTAKVSYDIRFGSLFAGSFGLQLGYKLNERWKLFADLEDIRDFNGTGWIYYDARTYGAGISYALK